MRLLPIALLLLSLVASITGCADLRTLRKAQQIDQQVKVDRIRFYDRTADAYRILAFEYYRLASEAEGSKQWAKARDYQARVTLYDTFSKHAKQTADELRAEYTAEQQGRAPAAAAAVASPDALPSVPAPPLAAPSAQQQNPPSAYGPR